MSIIARRTGQMHRPTFAELYVSKLVTVLREGYGIADFRADVASGLTVAIVALPLSMAIRHRLRRNARPWSLYGRHRRLHRVAARRQPVSDRRARRCVHRAGGIDRRASWCRGCDPCDRHGRGVPDRGRPVAARHLHQVHPLSGDGRIHLGHRGHHPGKPAQGSARHHACWQRAGRIRSKA